MVVMTVRCLARIICRLPGSKSLDDSGFLQFFRVVSSDYGKPRKKGMT